MSIHKPLHSWAFALAAIAGAILLATSPVRATILLNELSVNPPPPSVDGNREFIELISTTGGIESLSNLTLLLIDSAGGGVGKIDEAWDLGSFSTGANGLLILNDTTGGATYLFGSTPVVRPGGHTTGATVWSGMDGNDMSNNGFTALLVSGFTGVGGSGGQDLDSNDDGILNASVPWTSIVDSVGWKLGSGLDVTYSLTVLSQSGYTPDVAARRSDDTTANSAGAWYGGDMNSTSGDFTLNFDVQNFALPSGATLTPGSGNYPLVPEPSSVLLGLFGALGLVGLVRRRRSR